MSEIAGQIQSERGKIEAAQQRTTRIDAELVELRARIEQVDAEARAATVRIYHSSTILLPDGAVLSAGGGLSGPVTNFNAEAEGVKIEERKFTPEEAYAADEAFLTSASQFVMPIVDIDGRMIGGGQPGPVTRKLRDLFLQEAGK